MAITAATEGVQLAERAERLVRDGGACGDEGARSLVALDAASTELAAVAAGHEQDRKHHVTRQPFVWSWGAFDYDGLENRYTLSGAANRDARRSHELATQAAHALSRVNTAGVSLRRARTSGCR